MEADEVEPLGAGQHLEGAVNGNGHYGQLQLVSQHKGPLAERAHLSGEGACAFREDHHRHTVLQGAACIADCFLDTMLRASVHKDEVSRLASESNERDFL